VCTTRPVSYLDWCVRILLLVLLPAMLVLVMEPNAKQLLQTPRMVSTL
jgi:hypothetical protein